MSTLKLVYYPDPVLLVPAKPVETFDDSLQQLIDDMFETMYEAKGVGLAAPQIGISLQLAVIDLNEDRTSEKLCLINPQVLETKGHERMSEGCLSVPGVYETIVRPNWVKFKALDRFGNVYEKEATGLLAECVQHEIEHLEGKLYLDRLSTLKKTRVKQKMQKFLKYKSKKSS